MNKEDMVAMYKRFKKWCEDNPCLDLDPRLHTHSGPIGDGGYISHQKTRVAFAAWRAAIEAERADAERWRYIRRKLCLTGNGDGTCAMQAINLPANIQGWPEPGQVAEFCDAAIDAALSKENKV